MHYIKLTKNRLFSVHFDILILSYCIARPVNKRCWLSMMLFSWFTLGTNPYTGKEDWLFNGEYWKRDWTRCPQIF